MKRLFLFLLLASAAWGQSIPTVGTLVDGANNSTAGKERNVIVPCHYSDTQFKPAAFTISSISRTSNVVTATLASNPLTATPPLCEGMPVTVAGVTDSAFNGTFTLTSLTSTTAVWAQTAGNAFSSSGTVTAKIAPVLAAGQSRVDPQLGATITNIMENDEGPNANCTTNGVTNYYSTLGSFSKESTYVKLLCRNGDWFVRHIANRTNHCYGNFGTTSSSPVWSKTDDNVLYYMSSNTLRKLEVSPSCSTSLVITFTGYTSPRVGGEGTNGDADSALNTAGTKTLIPVIMLSGSNRILTVATAEDATYVTPVDTTCTNAIDFFRTWDDGTAIVGFQTSGSGTCAGTQYRNADLTYNRHIVTNAGAHSHIGISAEGDKVYVGLWNNTTPTSPCSSQQKGLIMYKATDSTATCIWNRTNDSFSGSSSAAIGAYVSVGDMRSPWAVLTGTHRNAERLESGLSSTWDTSWPRGADEAIVCKLTTGTNACYRVGFIRGATANSTGTEVYNWNSWCSAAPLETGAASGSAPKYFLCMSDGRAVSSTADSTQHWPQLWQIRGAAVGPTLTAVTPSSGTQGTSPAVALTGTRFDGGNASVSVSGSGVTPTSCSVTNATTIDCTSFTIAAGATTGARQVTVTTDEGTTTPQTFTVNAAAGSPAISSLNIAEGWRGAQITVVITGTNLNGANPVMGSTCTGVSFPSFTVNGATQITASVLMSSTATAQTCAISVTTDAGASNNQTFTVRVPSKPTKASVF